MVSDLHGSITWVDHRDSPVDKVLAVHLALCHNESKFYGRSPNGLSMDDIVTAVKWSYRQHGKSGIKRHSHFLDVDVSHYYLSYEDRVESVHTVLMALQSCYPDIFMSVTMADVVRECHQMVTMSGHRPSPNPR